MSLKFIYQGLTEREKNAVEIYQSKKDFINQFLRFIRYLDIVIHLSIHIYFIYLLFFEINLSVTVTIYFCVIIMTILFKLFHKKSKDFKSGLNSIENFLLYFLSSFTFILITVYNINRSF